MKTSNLLTLPPAAFWKAFWRVKKTPQLKACAARHAWHWDECACCALKGEARHYGVVFGAPKNRILHDLGRSFTNDINEHNYRAAHATYQKIQRLVKEENAK